MLRRKGQYSSYQSYVEPLPEAPLKDQTPSHAFYCECMICFHKQSMKEKSNEYDKEEVTKEDYKKREKLLKSLMTNWQDKDFSFILRRLCNKKTGLGELHLNIADTYVFSEGSCDLMVRTNYKSIKSRYQISSVANVDKLSNTEIRKYLLERFKVKT